MKKWIIGKLFIYLYKNHTDNLAIPIMIRKSHGNEWYFIDRYRNRYTIKETGDYHGTPLMIIKEEE